MPGSCPTGAPGVHHVMFATPDFDDCSRALRATGLPLLVAGELQDTRQPDSEGRLPAVGNTVDVANATWTNTIGDPELITVWQDPDFDPDLRAFYYVRVIEISTPRWTAYDARRYGIEMSEELPMITTERAYSSPIWYTP